MRWNGNVEIPLFSIKFLKLIFFIITVIIIYSVLSHKIESKQDKSIVC